MHRCRSGKGQGRIKINLEASETLHALFSQESDTSLVFSAAEHAANEKGDHSTSFTSTNETVSTNTCAGVNSLPRIVTAAPQPDHDNDADKKDAVNSTGSGPKRSSPPPIKLPLLPTQQPPRRIRSSVRRTPATNSNAEKRSPLPVKPLVLPTQQLSQPERTRSSVRRTPRNSDAEKQASPPPTKPLPTQPERIRFSVQWMPINFDVKKHSPSPTKPPTLPTQQLSQPERIRSSVRRTPSNFDAEKHSPPPTAKPPTSPLCQPKRLCSAALKRKAPFINYDTANDVSSPIVNYYM